jgi:hypothetical protein
MAAIDLTAITQSVTDTTTVEDSAILLLGQLADLLRANANVPGAITALASQLDAKKQALADAITANTPAA